MGIIMLRTGKCFYNHIEIVSYYQNIFTLRWNRPEAGGRRKVAFLRSWGEMEPLSQAPARSVECPAPGPAHVAHPLWWLGSLLLASHWVAWAMRAAPCWARNWPHSGPQAAVGASGHSSVMKMCYRTGAKKSLGRTWHFNKYAYTSHLYKVELHYNTISEVHDDTIV